MLKSIPISRYLPFIILMALSLLGIVLPEGAPTKLEGATINAADTAWMLTAAGLVLLMTPGLSFFYGGMVSRRNVISTMLQSFITLGVVSLLWVCVGFSLAFGDSIGGVIGDPRTYFMFRNVGVMPDPKFAATIPLVVFSLFQLKFAIITPALITGSFAERVRFSAYLIFICLFSIFIYAPLAHCTWHPDGFLRQMGVLDFAGGTVVHMSAGLSALAGAMVLGRRRVHIEGHAHVPSNIPFVILGTGMLWFGWFGFNAGSALAANETASLAFLTTNTASAAGMLGWIFFDMVLQRKPSALGACIGAVVGLVAITPAAGFVSVGSSIAIGCFSAVISNVAVSWKGKSQLDDTLDVFPCHGVGGILGMIFTAIFARDGGLITGSTTLFTAHMIALVIVSAFCFIGSYLLFKLVDILLPIRVSVEDEALGLDLSQHGEMLYTSKIDPSHGRVVEAYQRVIIKEEKRVA